VRAIVRFCTKLAFSAIAGNRRHALSPRVAALSGDMQSEARGCRPRQGLGICSPGRSPRGAETTDGVRAAFAYAG
jgi:hypothetical protein